jgi:hypothetical protein
LTQVKGEPAMLRLTQAFPPQHSWIAMRTLPLLSALLVTAVIAGPVAAQTVTASFSSKGDYVYLEINPPSATAPVVKLACEKGNGRVDIAMYEAKPADQLFNLISGPAKGELQGTKATGSRGDFLRSQIFAVDKIMLNFRQTGQLEIAGQGFRNQINIAANGKPAVEQFFVGCEEG